MPHQTRQNIIQILEQRETATAYDLSRLLKVTPSNIRHHLSILVRQGSIKVVNYRLPDSRGRPSAVYGLVIPTQKDNLDILSHLLLKKILDGSTNNQQEETLRWLVKYLVKETQLQSLNPTKRLYAAIHILNTLNYHACWEAHADTPRIMLAHCPYLAILEDHAEICLLDAYLIEHLTGAPVVQIAKRLPTPDGRNQCIFRFAKL